MSVISDHRPTKYKLQGIFDLWFKDYRGGQWLYTVRDDVASAEDAKAKCLQLSKREGKPGRVRIEDWNFPKSDADGFRFEMNKEEKR
jgi:hypothetical protein